MKKIYTTVILLFLCASLLFTGCRIRIMENADENKQDNSVQDLAEEETEQEETTKPQESSDEAKNEDESKSDNNPTDKQNSNLPVKKNRPQSRNTTDNNSSDKNQNDNNIPNNDNNGESSGSNSQNTNGGGTGQGSNGGGNDGNNGTGNQGSTSNNNENNNQNTTDNPNDSEPDATIKITLNANGGRCKPASVKYIMVAPDGHYSGLPDAVRGGYTFMGWYTSASGGTRITEESNIISNEPHTLYAQWTTREAHTVTFNPTDGWLGAQEKSRQVYTGQTYGNTFPVPNCYSGYAFRGWYTQAEGGSKVSNTDTFTSSSDITLYAQWDYDPVAYWSGYLNNASIFDCQIQRIYIEYNTDNVTTSYSSLISMIQSINAARTLNDTQVTDEQIDDLHPDVIVKCINNMNNASSTYNSMKNRFPGKSIYVLPISAERGSSEEKLYYSIYLASILYPSAFSSLDLNKVSSELGVSGNIYY